MLPPSLQDSLPAGWLAFAALPGGRRPSGSLQKVSGHPSSFSGLGLAQGKFHFDASLLVSLFDYLVGAGEQRQWHRKAKRLGTDPIGISLKQNENLRGGAATGPWSYLVVRSRGSGRACSPHSYRARRPEDAGCRQARYDRVRS